MKIIGTTPSLVISEGERASFRKEGAPPPFMVASKGFRRTYFNTSISFCQFGLGINAKMYYGIYRNIRDSAWQCLIDFDVKSLPVNVSAIARMAGIHVIKNSYVNELKPNEYGRSFYDGETWIVVYNDTQDPVISRFTLAHELGHFFLGHAITCAKYVHIKEFEKKPKAEKHADAFALRLLCPACVLHELNLQTATEIASTCRIPLAMAKLRATRMRELNKRNKFFTSPLEQKVYNNFNNFLSQAPQVPQ